jgi:hypothetical protein
MRPQRTLTLLTVAAAALSFPAPVVAADAPAIRAQRVPFIEYSAPSVAEQPAEPGGEGAEAEPSERRAPPPPSGCPLRQGNDLELIV